MPLQKNNISFNTAEFESQVFAFIILDLNNKVFVYFYLKRQSGWEGDPRSHEVLRDIFRFMESEYR